MIFIFLYVISHNRETTSLFAFLIIGTMIGEVAYQSVAAVEEEEEIEELEDLPLISNELN